VLADMRQIRNEFETEAEGDTRPFYFATGATTLIYRLGQPFRLLRRMYPKLDLHVTVLATEEIMAGVHRPPVRPRVDLAAGPANRSCTSSLCSKRRCFSSSPRALGYAATMSARSPLPS
jgi:hypothetical protein